MCAAVCLSVSLYVCIYVCMYDEYLYMHICTYVGYMNAGIYIYIYLFIYIRTDGWVDGYMYTHIHTYIQTHTLSSFWLVHMNFGQGLRSSRLLPSVNWLSVTDVSVQCVDLETSLTNYSLKLRNSPELLRHQLHHIFCCLELVYLKLKLKLKSLNGLLCCECAECRP